MNYLKKNLKNYSPLVANEAQKIINQAANQTSEKIDNDLQNYEDIERRLKLESLKQRYQSLRDQEQREKEDLESKESISFRGPKRANLILDNLIKKMKVKSSKHREDVISS